MTTNTRKNYTAEFKREAVRLITDEGYKASEAARSLDINANMLRRWIHKARDESDSAFPGKGNLSPEHEEIRKLRNNLITDKRLIHARKQLMGQLAISRENNEHLMLTSGKSYLLFNRVYSLETIKKNLEDITSSKLRDTANEIIDPGKLNTLIFE